VTQDHGAGLKAGALLNLCGESGADAAEADVSELVFFRAGGELRGGVAGGLGAFGNDDDAEISAAVVALLKAVGNSVNVEGWALYAEQLGYDMGLYENPYDRFGQLTYEMWRAVRLVVDTGLHAKGWSRDQAIAYFKDNAAKTELDIVNEIDRYIGDPGQALAYKVGQLKISELRTRAQHALGSRFDLRDFDDAVLAVGSVPLTALEARIDRWIAERKGL